MVARPVVLAAALAGLAAAPAPAEVVVEGRGFGHGIGLSQYGAYGFAQFADSDFRDILTHYYRGTSVQSAPAARVRVRLRRGPAHTVEGASAARGADGRLVTLEEARPYRFEPAGALVRVADARTGRTRARLAAPVRVTGGAAFTLRRAGAFRGALLLHLRGTRLLAVNDVHLRHYLYGVLPAEMPTTWPAQALRAQAVAARSYALRSLRPGSAFDVFPDTRSQVYGGLASETPAGSDAVRATDGLVVRDGEEIAQTFFHSTSGGRTAANEEIWTLSDPVEYLRSVEDPYDHVSPVHTWTVRMSDAEAERALGDELDGRLRDLRVVARTPSGRAALVRVRGSEGEREVPAGTMRTLLKLRSTWFEIRRTD